jgi:hypothetical protein
MSFTPQTGQRVKVRETGLSRLANPEFKGQRGTIREVNPGSTVLVNFDNAGKDRIFNGTWNVENLVLLANESTPIKFSLTTETSRDYAVAANSRVLSPPQQKVLRAASRGEEVDLRDFQKAVTAALSSATTRQGQSMARRALATKIRHLAYIADAVLDKVLAEGLPLAGKVLAEPEVREVVPVEVMEALDAAKSEVERLTEALAASKGEAAHYVRERDHALAQRDDAEYVASERGLVLEHLRHYADDVQKAREVSFTAGLRKQS